MFNTDHSSGYNNMLLSAIWEYLHSNGCDYLFNCGKICDWQHEKFYRAGLQSVGECGHQD